MKVKPLGSAKLAPFQRAASWFEGKCLLEQILGKSIVWCWVVPMVTRLATRAAGHRRPITSQLTDAVSLASRRPVEDVDGKCQMRDIGECASKGQEPGGSVEIVKSDIKRELGALVWRERERWCHVQCKHRGCYTGHNIRRTMEDHGGKRSNKNKD